MATGRLGSTVLSTSDTNTLIYTVPSTKCAIVTIAATNLTGSATRLYVAVTSNTANTPSDSEWLEYGVSLNPLGVYERTGVVISSNMRVICKTPIANSLAINVYGFEQDPT